MVKNVNSAVSYIDNIKYEIPYDGAKEMILVDNVDNRDYLSGLLVAMFDELPFRKK